MSVDIKNGKDSLTGIIGFYEAEDVSNHTSISGYLEKLIKEILSERQKKDLYDYITILLSRNVSENELTKIWVKDFGDRVIFDPIRPVLMSIRDICAKHIGMQEKKPRHPFML